MTQTVSKKPNRSRGELASKLVHDILEQEVEKRAGRPRPTRKLRRRRPFSIYVLLGVFLILAAWSVMRSGPQPQVFTPSELDAGVRFKIYLAVQALQAHRNTAGTWPASLDVIGFASEGLAYRRLDTTFQIVAATGGIPFTYRSGDDLAPFRDAARELVR